MESSIFVKSYLSNYYKTNRGTLSTTFILIDNNNQGVIKEFFYSCEKE